MNRAVRRSTGPCGDGTTGDTSAFNGALISFPGGIQARKPGEAHGNAVVDVRECNLSRSLLGRRSSYSGRDTRGDLNGDDRVDALDSGNFLRNLH